MSSVNYCDHPDCRCEYKNITKHRKTHQPKQPCTWTGCRAMVSDVESHVRTCHEKTKCAHCPKEFSSSSMKRHVRHAHEKVRYRCPVAGCTKDFAMPCSVGRHVKEKHLQLEITIVCGVCNGTIQHRRNVAVHVQSKRHLKAQEAMDAEDDDEE